LKINRPILFLVIVGVLLSHLTEQSVAQNVGIGAGSFTPSSKAMLEIQSTSSGLLIPRMTNAQRTALAPGAATNVSLLIFQTDVGATTPTGIGFYYWSGAIWVPLLANANTTTGPWDLKGNAGTVDGTNFLGTKDSVPLNFRVNNQKAGRIDPAGPVFLGYQAGINSTNDSSTAIGYQALFSANTGSHNVAIGQYTLYSNTTGSQNTAVGDQAVGSNDIGNNNTGVGFGAMISGNGNNNTAVGVYAYDQPSTGNDNTIVGYFGANQTDATSNNTVVGSNALNFNIWGGGNTAIGYKAVYDNNTVNFDVGVGYMAGPTTGGGATGNNVYLGANAGAGNGGGNFGTFIGSGANCTSTGFTNAMAIGNNASVSASNTVVLGNTGVAKWGFGINPGAGNILEFNHALTTACLTTGGNWTNASDSTLKTNIHNLTYGLNEIWNLKPVSYTLKKNGRNDIGFLAQEVKEVIPEIVYGESGSMSMSYGQLTAVLVKAMSEQQRKIELLKASISKLQTEISGINGMSSQKEVK